MGDIDAVNNDVSCDEEKAIGKVKVIAEQLGISLDEIKEKNISKKTLKRMLKNKVYNETKIEKRRIQKQKKKAKRKELKETLGINLSEKKNRLTMDESPNKVNIAIDLSFNSMMNEKELRKLMKQIQRCYSLNRRSDGPCQFYLTSLKDEIAKGLMSKQPGFDYWDIHRKEEHFSQVFSDFKEKGTLIFLSSDSPNLLPDVDEIKRRGGDYVYIIGGLVDHNVHKGLTLGLAQKSGIQTARLPIDQCMELCVSKVLAVNHVFEIMLNATNGITWSESFEKVIPARKVKQSNALKSRKKPKSVDQKENTENEESDKKSTATTSLPSSNNTIPPHPPSPSSSLASSSPSSESSPS
ncbi:tRNA methyltransferase 10 homolog A-like [Panonychus citri]|uniref:tRNA methyltransferase 10 homolog A-like n=1 Tax=Panonychus citri TaxID=50023 RepID=UPI002306FC0C|nr:tRNA methyltransferase 10 homolog A-like [Panonychus citri]